MLMDRRWVFGAAGGLVGLSMILIAAFLFWGGTKTWREPVTISKEGELIQSGRCRLRAFELPTYWAQMLVASKRNLYMTMDQIRCCDPKIKVAIVDSKHPMPFMKDLVHGDQVENLLCSEKDCGVADRQGVALDLVDLGSFHHFTAQIVSSLERIHDAGTRVVNLSLSYFYGTKRSEIPVSA